VSLAGRLSAAAKALLGRPQTTTAPGGFEVRAPSVQNAVDIFRGQWATDLSEALPGVEAGRHGLLTDARPRQAADALGTAGRLDGFSILELGPLEGAHSRQLEQLGAARVVAVEANVTAYLKCLVVKEVLRLSRTEFLLGDFSEYLRGSGERFDLIFASGVLYHMEDPLDLIALVCGAADRCFVWTHYYDAERCPGRAAEPASRGGFDTTYHRKAYGVRGAQFWGGNRDSASWMTKAAILDAFAWFGLSDHTVVQDDPEHVNGPAFTFVARRAG
jgi:hypothetical protein